MITLKQGEDFFATIKAKKIYRNFESESSIAVVNNGASETLPKTLLFTDNYACATFKVYLKETVIPNGESEVTLIYDGIYKRDTCAEKDISLNGSDSVLKINCAGSGGNPDEKPTIQNKSVSLNNRTDFDLYGFNFPSLYSSPTESPLTEISFWGDISTITHNGIAYVANTFIPYADVVRGDVLHTAPNVDSATNYGIYYAVKDSAGNVSDFAVLSISNNILETISWANKFINLRRTAGFITFDFTVNYTGATGQQVTSGDLMYVESGVNNFDISVNETKTLTGNGTLGFRLNADINKDGNYPFSFILFGTVNITVNIIVTINPEESEV